MKDREPFHKWCWNDWTPIGKEMNLDLNLNTFYKNQLKMDQGRVLRHKTTKHYIKKRKQLKIFTI